MLVCKEVPTKYQLCRQVNKKSTIIDASNCLGILTLHDVNKMKYFIVRSHMPFLLIKSTFVLSGEDALN